jgi:hypothetical protein
MAAHGVGADSGSDDDAPVFSAVTGTYVQRHRAATSRASDAADAGADGAVQAAAAGVLALRCVRRRVPVLCRPPPLPVSLLVVVVVVTPGCLS